MLELLKRMKKGKKNGKGEVNLGAYERHQTFLNRF
jgi:hypothetical protein